MLYSGGITDDARQQHVLHRHQFPQRQRHPFFSMRRFFGYITTHSKKKKKAGTSSHNVNATLHSFVRS
jgi:hypothetical protein